MNQQLIHHVPFHEETLLVSIDNLGEPFVVLKPIVEALGLDWGKQLARTKEHPVFEQGIALRHIPSAGGLQETTVLPLRLFHGWLLGINPNKVGDSARAKLLEYQEECYEVLASYFLEGSAINPRFHGQNFDLTKPIAGKQAFDYAAVAFGAISRAAERVPAHQVIAFVAQAADLCQRCLEAEKKPNPHDQEHLIKLLLDTGIGLHADEVSALTRTTPGQRARLLKAVQQSYPVIKGTCGLFVRYEESQPDQLTDTPE